MEFFETSASKNINISEVVDFLGNIFSWVIPRRILLFSFFLLPPVIRTSDRTRATGSQEGRGQPVGISGQLSGKGRSGGRQREHSPSPSSEELRLLETRWPSWCHSL